VSLILSAAMGEKNVTLNLEETFKNIGNKLQKKNI